MIKELRRIFSKDIIFKNTIFDEVYKIYEQSYQKLYMPDSTQSKQLAIAILYPVFLIPPAEKATETLTETKQWQASWLLFNPKPPQSWNDWFM